MNKADKYAIIADSLKDLSKKVLLGVSLRYFYEGNIKVRAIGFVELPRNHNEGEVVGSSSE